MTGIQTIHRQGLGGAAEIRGPRIHADYQPGAYELVELALCTFACQVAMIAVGMGFVLGAQNVLLGLICDAAGFVCLLAGFGAWRGAVRGLRTRGFRRIQLVRGWVEFGNEIRHLRDAVPVFEDLGAYVGIARLTLRFPDGVRIPLVQGTSQEVAAFAHAILTAPARGPAADATERRHAV